VLAVCTDPEGTVWAGTQAGMLHRFAGGGTAGFTRNDGLPGTPITALLPAREGGLWIGTGNGVLLHGDAHFKNVSTVKLAPRLSGKAILGLYESPDRTLWIGTAGAGLACLDAKGCSTWDSQDGLPDDIIPGVVGDDEGNLWLTTGKGLCRVPRAAVAKPRQNGAMLTAKLLLDTEPGSSQTLNFGSPRALRSPEGRLWFATGSGLVGIDTRGWQTEKPAPQIHLEAVLVDGQPLNLALAMPSGRRERASALKLPASLGALEFQFTALSFEAPEKVKFRHKLDHFDPDWIETGPERHVTYGRLPTGRYEFRVTACNAEGVWNPTGAILAFIIPTPLWRTSWALGLYGLSAAGGVAGTVRLVSHRRLRRRLARLEQQQSMERERVRIAQDMHDEIGSKLTKISFLSELAKVEVNGTGALADRIDSIADTSRDLLQALDEIVWAVNPRNDNLEQLGAYLSQYAREYFQNTPVECNVSLDGGLPQLSMSAELRHNLFLAFEESLNNVLKHSGASGVRIEIKVEAMRLQIIVSDNGRGFEAPMEPQNAAAGVVGTGPEGNGLVNMRQRLADVGGLCSIQSRVGQGTTVTLSISLNSAKLREP
jgi:signal transduction histidine kinase